MIRDKIHGTKSTMQFVGRSQEQESFRQLLKKNRASLVICWGRRRIGKSTLVEHCAKTQADRFLRFEGLAPRPHIGREEQLNAFAGQLQEQTRLPRLQLESWPQAFQLLGSSLSEHSSGWTYVLLDEVSWMAQGDKDFAGHLKTAWDNIFSKLPRLIVVVCGSVSSWIESNILNSTAFVGRPSLELNLGPLHLPECQAFWSADKAISAAEKLRVLSVTGGVPRYLEEIDPTQTAEQNIRRLCFTKGGFLYREFDQIFHDIFQGRAEWYRDIATALLDGRKTITEISKFLDTERGGTLSEAVSHLKEAGFLAEDVSFDLSNGKDRPRGRYRLSDNYLRFFLKYVRPAKEQIEKGLFRMAPFESFHSWDAIMGLQFENLILSDLQTLLHAIELDQTPVLNAGPYSQTRTQRRQGCQIDLMIRTRQSLYVVEMKFRKKIAKGVIEEVKQKVDRLQLPQSQSVRTALVYQGSLSKEVENSDYFDFLIPFERLLMAQK